MSQMQQILSPNVRRKAAFALMTSSTVPRYVRMAMSFGEIVAERAAAIDMTVADRVALSRDLWRSLVVEPVRSETEIDLALLLASIATAPDARVDHLLYRIGLNPASPSSSWVSALARSLVQRRAENELHSICSVVEARATWDADLIHVAASQIDIPGEVTMYVDAANQDSQLEAA